MKKYERKVVALAKRHMWTVSERTFLSKDELGFHLHIGPVKELNGQYLSVRSTSIKECYINAYKSLDGILNHNRVVYSPNSKDVSHSTTIDTGPK